jgi:hypothetical protein
MVKHEGDADVRRFGDNQPNMTRARGDGALKGAGQPEMGLPSPQQSTGGSSGRLSVRRIRLLRSRDVAQAILLQQLRQHFSGAAVPVADRLVVASCEGLWLQVGDIFS